MSRLSIWIICLALVLTGCEQKTNTRAAAGSNARTVEAETDWKLYFPTEQGSKWTYDSHIESAASRDEVRTVDVKGTEVVDGVECTLFEVQTNATVTTRDYLKRDEEGVAAYRQDMAGGTREISPPEYRLKVPLRTGTSWEWKGNVPVVGNVTVKYEISGREEVTVPAGTFPAFKVVTTTFDSTLLRQAESMQLGTIDVEVEPSATLTRWFAKDVGIVKEILKIKNVSVTSRLKKYEPQLSPESDREVLRHEKEQTIDEHSGIEMIQGEVPPTSVASSLPKWFPSYPSIEDTYSVTDATSVNFLTKDAPSDVVEFYKKHMTEQGFTFDSINVGGGAGIIAKAEKQTNGEAIELEIAIVGQQGTFTQVVAGW